MTKLGKKTATTIKLDISDFARASHRIASTRMVQIIRALMRAQLYDQWDLTGGYTEFDTGDSVFEPRTDMERWYWTTTRAKMKASTVSKIKKAAYIAQKRPQKSEM